MSWRQIKVLELVDFEKEPPLSISDWLTTTRQLLAGGARPVSVFSQRTNRGRSRLDRARPCFC